MTEHRVQFTVEAHATYEALPGEHRTRPDRAVRILARDPFLKNATAQFGPDPHLRRAYVAPGVMPEYMVAGAVVVVVLEIFDESAYLVDEADAQ